jgi:hypothetical protein
MPRKDFQSFTRLDASDVNSFLMDQTVMTFAGTAARGSAIPTPVDGMVTTDAVNKNLQTYYTSWRPLPFAVAAGRGSIGAPSGLNIVNVASFTFPAGRFTVAPVVTISAEYTSANSKFIILRSVTSAGFDAGLYQQAGGTLQGSAFGYIAVQMSNGSADG